VVAFSTPNITPSTSSPSPTPLVAAVSVAAKEAAAAAVVAAETVDREVVINVYSTGAPEVSIWKITIPIYEDGRRVSPSHILSFLERVQFDLVNGKLYDVTHSVQSIREEKSL